MRKLAFAFVLILLPACSLIPGANLYLGAAREKARAAAQDMLAGAEWQVCRAAPVGSVIDRYGDTPDSAERWRSFCQGSREANVIAPAD